MSTDKNVLLHQHNGTDWDNIYPKSKDTLVELGDLTKTTLGLTGNKTVSDGLVSLDSRLDVFDYLNMHLWRRQPQSGTYSIANGAIISAAESSVIDASWARSTSSYTGVYYTGVTISNGQIVGTGETTYTINRGTTYVEPVGMFSGYYQYTYTPSVSLVGKYARIETAAYTYKYIYVTSDGCKIYDSLQVYVPDPTGYEQIITSENQSISYIASPTSSTYSIGASGDGNIYDYLGTVRNAILSSMGNPEIIQYTGTGAALTVNTHRAPVFMVLVMKSPTTADGVTWNSTTYACEIFSETKGDTFLYKARRDTNLFEDFGSYSSGVLSITGSIGYGSGKQITLYLF